MILYFVHFLSTTTEWFYIFRYLVTDLINYNLNDLLRSEKLEENLIILITYQILRGLKYLHSANIIHRVSFNYLTSSCLFHVPVKNDLSFLLKDLKPSNITVNTDCTVKVKNK
jgi:serine/threonine protein kinase